MAARKTAVARRATPRNANEEAEAGKTAFERLTDAEKAEVIYGIHQKYHYNDLQAMAEVIHARNAEKSDNSGENAETHGDE